MVSAGQLQQLHDSLESFKKHLSEHNMDVNKAFSAGSARMFARQIIDSCADTTDSYLVVEDYHARSNSYSIIVK